MQNFKIRFHSGVGDCFRLLSEQPSIDLYNKKYGLKIHWVYDNYSINEYNNLNFKSDLKPPFILYDIFKNVDFLKLVSQEECNDLDCVELSNWHNNQYASWQPEKQLRGIFPNQEHQGFSIPLIEVEKMQLASILKDTDIFITVQISGKGEGKTYSTKKYVELFKSILQKYPTAKIFLVDYPTYTVNPSLLIDDRIVNLVGKISRAQEINLIQKADWHICPDSYSKYIRNWVSGKQTILCSSVSWMTDTELLRECFGRADIAYTAGLVYNPNVKILGAQYKENLQDVKMVDSIQKILPEEIFDSIDINKK